MSSDSRRLPKYHPLAWLDRVFDLLADGLGKVVDSPWARGARRWVRSLPARLRRMGRVALLAARRAVARVGPLHRLALWIAPPARRAWRGCVAHGRSLLSRGEDLLTVTVREAPERTGRDSGQASAPARPPAASPRTVTRATEIGVRPGSRPGTAPLDRRRGTTGSIRGTTGSIKAAPGPAASGTVTIHCWHCRGTTPIAGPRRSGCYLCSYCGRIMEVFDVAAGRSRPAKRGAVHDGETDEADPVSAP
jgi:hypothetical protein